MATATKQLDAGASASRVLLAVVQFEAISTKPRDRKWAFGLLERGADGPRAGHQAREHNPCGDRGNDVRDDDESPLSLSSRARCELFFQLATSLLRGSHGLAARALVLGMSPIENRNGALDLVEADRGRIG